MSRIRLCRICELRDAKYICRECGREICEYDFDPINWLCTECIKKFGEEKVDRYVIHDTGFKIVTLIFLAFILITFGFFLIALGGLTDIKTVTFIFPFFVTTDPLIGFVALAITILLFLLIIYVVLYRIPRMFIGK